MRIAILTLPLHTNYGGILQAYALQTVLERMGHDVKVLSPPPYKAHRWFLMPLVYCKRIVQKWVQGKDVSILYDGYHRPRQHTDKFITRHIHSYIVHDWSKLKEDFDCFVVGSDQIWRPKYATMFSGLDNAFLAFADGWPVVRISYAVSFGTSNWEFSETETKRCRTLASKFNAISVRELSGINLCSKYLDCDAVHVLDPTFLLEAQDYFTLSHKTKKQFQKRGYIASYILDKSDNSNYWERKISESYDLDIIQLNSSVEDELAPKINRIQPPVESWIDGIRNAEYIITDSFHACVFSIIFKKQFFCIINEGRGRERIISLLGSLNLENRIISDGIEIQGFATIDYSSIDKKIQLMSKQSLQFLVMSLSH